jgi:hypothetical protein
MRALDKWLLPYLKRRIPQTDGPVHLFLSVCDHFEPLHASNKEGAMKRLAIWEEQFPKLIEPFRDVEGIQPRHTFFFPVEQYDPDLLDRLAGLCRKTGSEVEIHLHHENDTSAGVRAALEKGKRDLESHGLLPVDQAGETRYGFIHGNWALNHSHPEGKGCGVDREIPILRDTGCYADFTMPSAPSPSQSRLVNSIAYAEDLAGAEALNRATPVVFGEGAARREDRTKLLMIQGPMALNWGWRKWGLVPRIENGDLTGANPPTPSRLDLAARQRISVEGKPDWVFAKFHTHGGIESNFEMLLGEGMRRFHESLPDAAGLQIHYVTAREMANLVHAAEDGCTGDPGDYRDYQFRLRP